MTLGVGKFSEEKVKALGIHWAMALDLKYPSLNFARTTGLKAAVPEDKEAELPVCLANLKTLKKHPSDGPEPEDLPFKAGDEVTVIKRMSLKLPLSTNKDYRKDLVEGTEGIVKGWAPQKEVGPYKEKRLVLLQFKWFQGGKSHVTTHPVTFRNLKLTSEYLLEKR